MDSNTSLSDVLHKSWAIHDEDIEISGEETHEFVTVKDEISSRDSSEVVPRSTPFTKREGRHEIRDLDKEVDGSSEQIDSQPLPSHSNLMSGSTYSSPQSKQMTALQHALCCSGYVQGISVSSNYHQPFVSMVRQKKTSAIANALQRPAQTTSTMPTSFSSPSGFPYGDAFFSSDDLKHNFATHRDAHHFSGFDLQKTESVSHADACAGQKATECAQSTSSTSAQGQQKTDYDITVNLLDSLDDADSCDLDENEDQKNRHEKNVSKMTPPGGDADILEDGIIRHETNEKLVENGDTNEVGEKEKDQEEEIIVVDRGEDDAATTNDRDDIGSSTSSGDTKKRQSFLEKLLMQPPKKPTYQEYQPPYVVTFTAIGNQPQLSKTMQFYQPPAQQHLARSTPPPGYPQPYGMGMRPHEEETRQIMNLDSQQTHNSSPTSTWNQPYGQMTNLNAYQQRGPNIYAQPVPPSMVHQNGPPGVVPTSNPYYPTPGPPPPPHHHIQPQAPMMASGIHGQQQQPYYNTQSPLTGTPPTMSYGTSQIPAPPPAVNGSAPIFNFSKPRNSSEGASVNGGGHRRKKHNDLSSPRYNNNGNEDVDASIFPDMTDFPLLDVVQSKAKKDAGRKPCRPHLCEQSRMLISRVCHFHREFVKRLPARHPLANSPFSKPDQWTSQIMGISLATVRKCIDMAVDEEVFTRCTDKNLVNLTPSERAEREETLSRLSTVFEGEKSLGAGTAGMTIAEYSPRRSYSNTLIRQSTDDKSSNSSFVNGADYGSSETTLLNLDDHSNQSKDFGTTPTPTMESSNGGHVFEDIGSIGGNVESEVSATVETPKRGRPRKTPGTTTTKSSKRKESQGDSEVAEDKDDLEKKTEDEDETNEETEKQFEELEQDVQAEREDDAASSEGTNRSETATPEPEADTSVAKKTRAAARRKNTKTVDEEFPASAKKKRGSVTSATAGLGQPDDENSDHKMVTRARSRQP
ncbi:unnamed protein product [Caenorhabditis brenneri]